MELTVAHQFDDYEQQQEAATLGMWIFLATEILFFGGLFLGYTVYRSMYPAVYGEASRHLDIVRSRIKDWEIGIPGNDVVCIGRNIVESIPPGTIGNCNSSTTYNVHWRRTHLGVNNGCAIEPNEDRSRNSIAVENGGWNSAHGSPD